MTPRQRRLSLVAAVLAGVAIAAGIAALAFQDNLQYFYNPSEVAAGKVPEGKRFRVGGMVPAGSVVREPGSLEVKFAVTDYAHTVKISYTGVLPDLFREGQGIIAHGRLADDGVFVADEVLAKHDEKYMPPEVRDSLKQTHATPSTTASGTPPAGSPQP